MGALVNARRPSLVGGVVEAVRSLDFSPALFEVERLGLRDSCAEAYLAPELSRLAGEFGVELVPVVVDSDGSCLPHALSRCLVGKEVLFDVLRSALARELAEHEAFYRGVLAQGRDEATWREYWSGVVAEAAPTLGEHTSRWLGPEHILGLCNVLCRPVLLVDARGSELFLPLRLGGAGAPSLCGGGPLALGWGGASKNHFVALVAPGPPAPGQWDAADETLLAERAGAAAPRLWETVDLLLQRGLRPGGAAQPIAVPAGRRAGDVVLLRDSASGEEHVVRVPAGLAAGDVFEWSPPPRGGAQRKRARAALLRLFALNAPALRARSCTVLLKALSNLIDALLLGDEDKVAKVAQLPLDNKAVEAHVRARPGAVELLEAVGFELREGDRERGARPALVFDTRAFGLLGAPQREERCEALVMARDALTAMRLEGAAVLGAGQVPVARRAEAFGPGPAFLLEWDGAAGADGTAEGAFVFGLGDRERLARGAALLRDLLLDAKACFRLLARGTDLERLDWDDPARYDAALGAKTCAACARLHADRAQPACDACGAPLGPDTSGASRISAMIAAAIRAGALPDLVSAAQLHGPASELASGSQSVATDTTS